MSKSEENVKLGKIEKDNSEHKSLSRFVKSMLKVGLIGFGGGSALIPVIEDEVIKNQGIDNKENYDMDVVVASITPGALPIEIAGSLGKRNFGIKGMVLGALMMGLPGAFLTVLLLSCLSSAESGIVRVIEVLSIGVAAFIMYLLTNYIQSVMKTCKKESNVRLVKAIGVMVGVFVLACGKNLYKIFELDGTPILSVSTFHILIAAFFFVFYTQSQYTVKNLIISAVLLVIYLLSYGKSNVINNIYITRGAELIMLVLAIYGLVKNFKKTKMKKKLDTTGIAKDVAFWLIVLVIFSLPALIMCFQDGINFCGKGLLSALMSFGGGDAYLTIADGLFVDGGQITDNQFYGQIVTLVNVLPGSILCKTLSAVGYYAGLNVTGSKVVALTFSLAGFACSIAASCGFFAVIYYLYESMTNLIVFQTVARWIRPIISGLLVNIMFSLVRQDISAATNSSLNVAEVLIVALILYIMDFIFAKKLKWNHVGILLFDVAVVIVLFLVF